MLLLLVLLQLLPSLLEERKERKKKTENLFLSQSLCFQIMKLTPSPSISTSTLTGIFPTSKGSVFGCLSFVFRRILCSRSLPTHPFDQFREIDPFENTQKSDAPATPNLVARLMGLDSLPETTTLKEIARSKSMNLADCRFEETGEVQGQHRRVKTSVSFKETPCFFELEDDDFLVLSFESGRKNMKSRVKRANSDMGGRKDEQWRRFKIKEIDRGSRSKMENCNGEVLLRTKKKKKKEKYLVEDKVETESDESENLSPVSVLDHNLFIGDHEQVSTSAEEETARKQAPDHNNETFSKEEDNKEPSEAIEVIQAGLQRKDYHSHQNLEMLNQVCKLAESEMGNSEWECINKMTRNLKVWEDQIGGELGLQIVDQLVDELVNQLFCCAN